MKHNQKLNSINSDDFRKLQSSIKLIKNIVSDPDVEDETKTLLLYIICKDEHLLKAISAELSRSLKNAPLSIPEKSILSSEGNMILHLLNLLTKAGESISNSGGTWPFIY